jgi:hypothetical protein
MDKKGKIGKFLAKVKHRESKGKAKGKQGGRGIGSGP